VATESSLEAVSKPWLFKPGQSGNPGGRAKGLASLVREQTRDGAELVEFMLSVLRGKKKAPLRLRMEAAAWLADRGFGRVAQPLTGADGGPMRFTLALSAAGAAGEAEDDDG
jgi:hypothetical protein